MVTQLMERATVRVRRHERGLMFVNGDFSRVLGPGEYRFWDRILNPERTRVEMVSVLTPRLEHPLLDVLLEDVGLREQVRVFDLSQTQRALVWVGVVVVYVVWTLARRRSS